LERRPLNLAVGSDLTRDVDLGRLADAARERRDREDDAAPPPADVFARLSQSLRSNDDDE
jgi:hypothetical protein